MNVTQQCKTGVRPLPPDRIAAVPVLGSGADLVEDAAARRRQVRHLDHGAGMALVPEIDEAPARAVALLAYRVAAGEGAPVERVVVLGPARPVLQPLVAGGQEVAPHAGGVAPLLDQLDLHVPGIGERDREVNAVVARAAVAEGGQRQPVDVEPRPDPADLDPVAHRRLDVAHHVPHLAQRSEQPAHGVPPSRVAAYAEPRPCATVSAAVALRDRWAGGAVGPSR